jgi:hypothetical protein
MHCAGDGFGSAYGFGTPGAYGLGVFDPSLEGFNPFKIITAPFRAGAKVVSTAARQVIKHGPRTVGGFLVGGPMGAAAALAAPLIRGGSPGQTTSAHQGIAPTYTTQPTSTSFRLPGQLAIAAEQPQNQNIVQMVRDELLRVGGNYIAGTPAGQTAIRERVTGDIGRYMLPLAIGGGALLLILAMRR